MKYLNYKNYTGTIEYSKDDNLLFGKVLGLKALISYEGNTGNELEENFKQAIEQYLIHCKENNLTPEKPFKGSFNVRIPTQLHQKAALLAMEAQISLNYFVTEAIRARISKEIP